MNITAYNNTLNERIQNSPIWLPTSISSVLMQLLLLNENPSISFTKSDQNSINSYMYKQVKLYNKTLSRIVLEDKDDHVFITPKVFPLYSLEWFYSTYEFMIQYEYELDWIYAKMFYKLRRIMQKRYNQEITNGLYQFGEYFKETKIYDWNKVLFTMLLDLVEYNFTEDVLVTKLNSNYILDVIFSASRIPWSINDNALFNIPPEYKLVKNNKTKASILLLNMLDNIATKTISAKIQS